MACWQVSARRVDEAPALCRNLGGVPAAERAEVTGVDGTGLSFDAGDTTALHRPFLEPVSDSSHVRLTVVNLDRAA